MVNGWNIDEKDDILLQFDNYVYNRVYNQNIVNIVLLLISNAYKIKINVYVLQEDGVLYRLRKILPGIVQEITKAKITKFIFRGNSQIEKANLNVNLKCELRHPPYPL